MQVKSFHQYLHLQVFDLRRSHLFVELLAEIKEIENCFRFQSVERRRLRHLQHFILMERQETS